MKIKVKNNNENHFQTDKEHQLPQKNRPKTHHGENKQTKQAILNSRVSSRKMSLSSLMETLQPLKILFFGHLGVNITVEPHII